MANEKIKIRLQGHEKFVLREGWLNKGITQVHSNPLVFLGKEGPDVKQLLANLLYIIEELQMEEVIVDRPNYSQRVRLKNAD